MSRLRRVIDDGRLMQAVQPGASRVRVEARDAGRGERDIAFGDLLDTPDPSLGSRPADAREPREETLPRDADGGAVGDGGKPAVAIPLRPAPAPAPVPVPAHDAAPAPAHAAPGVNPPAAARAKAAATPTAAPAARPTATPPGWQPLLPGVKLQGPTAHPAAQPVAQPAAQPVSKPPAEPSEKPALAGGQARSAGPLGERGSATHGGIRAWLQHRQRPASEPSAPPPPASVDAAIDPVGASLSMATPAATPAGGPTVGPVRWADLVRTASTRAAAVAPSNGAGTPGGEAGLSGGTDAGAGDARDPAPQVRTEVADAVVGSDADEPIMLVDRVAPGPGALRTGPSTVTRPAAPATANQGGTHTSPEGFAGASTQGTSSGMRLRVPTADGETLRGDVRVDSQARGVRLALATENAQTARSLSSAHEMLRAQLADEGYQLDSYVIRHDGRSVVRMDSGSADAQAHADARDREGARGSQDPNPDQRPRQPAREMSDDPVVAGWFV